MAVAKLFFWKEVTMEGEDDTINEPNDRALVICIIIGLFLLIPLIWAMVNSDNKMIAKERVEIQRMVP